LLQLGPNRYGKSHVRLVRLDRQRDHHELLEWELEVLLRGDFENCFREGDNGNILPTDTIKNTVYSLARKLRVNSMEQFAQELIDFLLGRNPQLFQVEVSIAAKDWTHLQVGGKRHCTTFVHASGELQKTRVERTRNTEFCITSGLENLIMMKTANSGFEGFMRDSLTTLQPTSDRLLGTALRASWPFRQQSISTRFVRGYENFYLQLLRDTTVSPSSTLSMRWAKPC
jgi:urate oxidase